MCSINQGLKSEILTRYLLLFIYDTIWATDFIKLINDKNEYSRPGGVASQVGLKVHIGITLRGLVPWFVSQHFSIFSLFIRSMLNIILPTVDFQWQRSKQPSSNGSLYPHKSKHK